MKYVFTVTDEDDEIVFSAETKTFDSMEDEISRYERYFLEEGEEELDDDGF